jgi:glycerol-3-phosphate acyltransferase PlsY
MIIRIILGCFLSYITGSIPFSYIIAKRIKGVDLRYVGEGNVGGRNVWHVVGKKFGILAAALDFLKGLAAFGIGYFFGLFPWWIWLCGFFVVLGHDFPIFLRLKGGKGAASAFGFLLGMQPLVILGSLVLTGLVYFPFRKFHLAMTIGMGSIPVLWYFVSKKPLEETALLVLFLVLLGLKRIIDEPHMKKIKQESGW